MTYRPPSGETTGQVLNDFVRRAVIQQPPVERWRFQTTFPLYFTYISLSTFHHWEGHPPTINHPLAHALRDYQLYGGFTPGPVLLACVVLAFAGGLGAGRARRSGQQLACLLWLAAGLGLLLAADLYPVLVALPATRAGDHPAGRSARPVGPHITEGSTGTASAAGADRSGRPGVGRAGRPGS